VAGARVMGQRMSGQVGIPTGNVKVLDGNRAAAHAVRMCRPNVICAYPITPQTDILETLYTFHAEGLLDAEMVEVESEHSAMGVLRGAALAGGRTFTATNSQGLALMYENCIYVATVRLPIVMVNVCREMGAPHAVTAGEQDIMMFKEAGWIHIHARNCQEIFDSVIIAYRLAEDPEVRLPVAVCYDGYFLSHQWEPVEIPSQEEVDRYLPPLTLFPRVDPETPLTFGPFLPSDLGTEYRWKQSMATERAKSRLEELEAEFREIFGRHYGGQVDEYRTDDADVLLVALGSCASTAMVAVDRKRDEGIKIGLVAVRLFRPFPSQRLAAILKRAKAVGVIDRNVCFGWNCGSLFMEAKAALYGSGAKAPFLNFIGGLCGADITIEQIERAIEATKQAAANGHYQEVTWLDLE
jgi:phenylglyoxylate dehydrogenase alpha subunit